MVFCAHTSYLDFRSPGQAAGLLLYLTPERAFTVRITRFQTAHTCDQSPIKSQRSENATFAISFIDKQLAHPDRCSLVCSI
jgi:hypothetical protein